MPHRLCMALVICVIGSQPASADFGSRISIDIGIDARYLNGKVEYGERDLHLTSDRYSHLEVTETAQGPRVSAIVGDSYGYGIGSRWTGGLYLRIGIPVYAGLRLHFGYSGHLRRNGSQTLEWSANASSVYPDQYGTFTYESRFRYMSTSLALEYHPNWFGLYATVGREVGIADMRVVRTWERFDASGRLYTNRDGSDFTDSEATTFAGVGWLRPLSAATNLQVVLSYGLNEYFGGAHLQVGLRATPF